MFRTFAFLLAATALCSKSSALESENTRKLIAGGQDATPEKFDYFVTVNGETDSAFFAGALIAPQFIVFGLESSSLNSFPIVNLTVTIGRNGDAETRSITEFRRNSALIGAGVLTDWEYVIARLDSPSTKTPVAIDDGSLSVGAGQSVSLLGKGKNFTSSQIAVANTLQKIDVELVDKSECIGAYNRSTFFDDFNLAYFYFLLPGETPPASEPVPGAEEYFDAVEELIENDEGICLKLDSEQGLCGGDIGAPVVIVGERDTLVGLHLTSATACFPNMTEFAPTSIVFTSGIYSQIQADLSALALPVDSSSRALFSGVTAFICATLTLFVSSIF